MGIILSICDEHALRLHRRNLLKSEGYDVISVPSSKEVLTAFEDNDLDLVIVCHSLPLSLKHRLCSFFKFKRPLTPVLVFRCATERQSESVQADGFIDQDQENGFLPLVKSLARRGGTRYATA
ncbi:MAG TPA: hypothetical protein VM056_06080 [Terriglobales bacterium]|nr:hypothetical protein [Terriglobales bacterium]